jgi:ferredoxin/flavodoxin---NADP+ reductase
MAVRMTETPSEVDLLIVGAGPTGLFAAYYAGFRELSTALVDSLPEAGGQVTAMYPEKKIFDVAGFPTIIGRDLVAQLVEQADQFKPTYLLGRKARTVTDADDGFDVGLDDGAVIRAGAILITAGMGEFTPRPLPAGDGWFGRGVVNFVPSLEEHRDQDVVVVGGGDSAFDWALSLHGIARSITLVHRRNKFRAFAATVRQVRELGVPIITDAQVVAVRGEDHVAEVELSVASDPSPVVLPAQTVVAALGFTADLGPIESWGLEIIRRGVAVDTTMKTARDRIYAAGDIAAYPGKVKLIATGFGEAATAVNNIAVALNPDAHLFPGHSSDVS